MPKLVISKRRLNELQAIFLENQTRQSMDVTMNF